MSKKKASIIITSVVAATYVFILWGIPYLESLCGG